MKLLHNYTKFKPWMLNGHPGNITRACKRAIVRGINHGLRVTATTDGVHATTSWHTAKRLPPTFKKVGRAVDMGTAGVSPAEARERKIAFQHSEIHRHTDGKRYREIIGPDDKACVLGGRRQNLVHDSALENQHDTHTHVAPIS